MNARHFPAPPGRVLLIHQSSDLYGSDRMLLAVASGLQQAGSEPIVLLPRGGLLAAALRQRGIETHEVAPAHVMRLTRRDLSPAGLAGLAVAAATALPAIDRCVAGRTIDLVYSNTLAVLGGAWWSRRRGVRHLWHLHEVIERPSVAAGLLAGLVARGADTVVCNSHATRRWLVGLQPGLVARSTVVWNGVEPAPAVPLNPGLAAALRPAGTSVAIGLIGRINRFKGQALLLAAMELLHERGDRRCALVFVGSAPAGQPEHEARLRARIAASPLADRVVMTGFVHDPAPYLAALDIVCMPSLASEGLGLAAIEAMAAGRPVVAADVGGLPEVVQNGLTGWLHARGDAAALAERLSRLLADPARRLAMGQLGQQRHRSHFTVERMMAGLQDAIGSVATRPA